MTSTELPVFASPADVDTFGTYRFTPTDDHRPPLRFDGRLTSDGASPYAPDDGRYHLYAGRFCPWSQRLLIIRQLAGLDDAISVSFVHGERDGRGWAFREPTGADPVNGFTFLREAYDATEPGFDGLVSVPVLWDRHRARIVSNQATTLGTDLIVQYRDRHVPAIDLYPADLVAAIDAISSWVGPVVNWGAIAAAGDGGDAEVARRRLRDALSELDRRLAGQRFLTGDRLTDADVRLFPTLVRFDVGVNADRSVNHGLASLPNLWAYARDLYTIPAVRATTWFDAIAAAGASVPDWDDPPRRGPAISAWHRPTDRRTT